MLHTIIAIITVIIMLAYVYRFINRIYNSKSYFNEFIVILLCLLVLTFITPDSVLVDQAVNDAYNRGFNDAIKTAELIEVNEHSYYISFGENIPEVHHYTFDGHHLVDIAEHN